MDSLSQVAFGAAIGVAAMGRRTAAWKAALWGAVARRCPTSTSSSTTATRSATWCCTAAETPRAVLAERWSRCRLAAAVARLHGEPAQWRRWWLAIWLALVTHPLLDAMTVYGTQLRAAVLRTTRSASAASSSSTRCTRCRCWSAPAGRWPRRGSARALRGQRRRPGAEHRLPGVERGGAAACRADRARVAGRRRASPPTQRAGRRRRRSTRVLWRVVGDRRRQLPRRLLLAARRARRASPSTASRAAPRSADDVAQASTACAHRRLQQGLLRAARRTATRC